MELSSFLEAVSKSTGSEPKKVGGNYLCRCPAHDDQKASLSVRQGEKGIVLHCFAGCLSSRVLEALGLSMRDLASETVTRKPKKRIKPEPYTGLTFATMEDGIASYHGEKGKPDSTEVYHDAKNQAACVILRWDSPGGKEIRQLSKFPDGNWGRKAMDEPRVLYNLPMVLAAPDGAMLFVTEGEKCARALNELGILATTSMGGCNAAARTNWSPLAKKKVYICLDNDAPGVAYGNFVAERAYSYAAEEIHIVSFEDLAEGEDVYDWLQLSKIDPMNSDEVIMGLRERSTPWSSEFTILMDSRVPTQTAAKIREMFYTHPDKSSTLIYYAGEFFVWREGAYRPREKAAIVSQIYDVTKDQVGGDGKPFNPTEAKVKNVLGAIQAQSFVSSDIELPFWLGRSDINPREFISFPNGILHVPTGDFFPPTPKFVTRNALEFEYSPKELEPVLWLNFLDQLWGGDQESKDLLQEWFGYCLTSDTRQQKALLMVGPRRAGKGVCASVLTSLLGNRLNVCFPTMASLSASFGIEDLLGKTLAIIGDALLNGRDTLTLSERLLSIIGEDPMSVQRKFKEAHHVRLQTRFMILTNQIPNLSDSSGALTGRFLILDFRQTFYGREDITLKDKLERELPGILHWAIAGWRRLRARGKFVEPASSGESREIMEEMGNPIKTFFEECVDQQPHFEIDGMRLYKCYCKWLEEKGFKILPNSTTFKRNLRASYMNITSEVYRDHRGVRSQKYRGLDVRPLDQFMGIY